MTESQSASLYTVDMATGQSALARKQPFVDRRWMPVISRLQQNRNQGCRFVLVDVQTFQVGVIIAMEKSAD